MFALIDCNNFYASCERVFQPHLNGKPLVILSNNDGCVIARSNEAKSLGIPMGAPAFKYKEIFQKNNVQIFSSNFTLYGDMSNRVMSIIARHLPDVEIYSIDEAFVKFSGFSEYEANKKCKEIIETVIKWTGIPVSIGLAPTKSLAKVANRIAKKNSTKTNGFYSISSNKKRLEALNNKIAVCYLNGEFTVKRVKIEKDHVYLMPENKKYDPIKVTEENEFIVWGIVTYVVKKI